MKRKIYLSAALLLIFITTVQSQPYERTFEGYDGYAREEYHIKVSLPNDYKDLNVYMEPW